MIHQTEFLKDKIKFCSALLTMKYALDIIGYNISRSFIRNYLMSYSSYPNISLETVSDFFTSLDIENYFFKVNTDFLKSEDMIFPAIFVVPSKRKKTLEFCVLISIKEDIVEYYSPNKGILTERLNYLDKVWNNVVLLFEASDEILNTSFAQSYCFNEEESILKYIENLEIIDNYIGDDTCKYIIDYCESNDLFKRSMVTGYDNKNSISKNRTSFSAFIREREETILKEIYEKVSSTLKLPKTYIEDLQCVRYGKGQEFSIHFDPIVKGDLSNRVHTLILYLNDDFVGGETYFPEVNIKVNPKKGRLLHFLNKDSRGNSILFSSHAGLPVSKGVKYACNIWLKDDIIT